MSKKFIIGLQYWDGDKEQALELLDLYCKTIPQNNKFADLAICYRFDSSAPSDDILEKLKIPFENVYVIKSKEDITGYPAGCNALWSYLMTYAYINYTSSYANSPKWEKYKCVFTLESDTCPIHKNWLQVVSEEWDKSNAKVLGCWSEFNVDFPEIGHINGNGMFAMDIIKIAPKCTGTPSQAAWDTYHAPEFKEAGWKHTEKIANWFKRNTINQEEYESLKKDGFVFLHGVKDDSVRKLYLNDILNET